MMARKNAVRLSAEEYRRVLAFFEKAVRAEPNQWHYWGDICFCRGKLGQWREAAEALERVADKSAALLNMLGHAYIKLERYREAEIVLDKAHALAPDNVKVLYNRAVVHFHCDDLALALNCLEQVIRNRPSHLNAQYSLGLIFHRLGDQQAAASQLAIVRELNQGFADRLAKIVLT